MRRETPAWQATHRDPVERQRRLQSTPAKLARLGLTTAPLSSRVLDTCCGSGEALQVLHDRGFHSLTGIDLDLPPVAAFESPFTLFERDATDTHLPDESFDWITNLNSLHHFANPEGVAAFLAECHRLLMPGGRLAITDFPSSPQIKLLFWLLRHNVGTITPYLRFFARVTREEWSFLPGYLKAWPEVREQLLHGRFTVERFEQDFFVYYLVLRKPA